MPPASCRVFHLRTPAARPSLRRSWVAEVEKAARRWLERYIVEASPGLAHLAETACDLAKAARLPEA